jgi:hypothetical protein
MEKILINARKKRIHKRGQIPVRKIKVLPELEAIFKDCFVNNGCMPS